MVAVTKKNFIEQSNDFLEHLPTAAFVALDEEMTGISLPSSSGRFPKDQTPSQRYPDLKKVPETYSIIQLGISLFHYTGKVGSSTAHSPASDGKGSDHPDWTVRRYNFFTFPDKNSNRSVVLDPSAIAFLNEQNISFDKWTKEGIPFQLEKRAQETLENYIAKEKADQEEALKQAHQKQPTIKETAERRVQLRRTDDIDFFSRAMASLRNWLDSPVSAQNPGAVWGGESVVLPEGVSYLMPACNAFLRRALYESIGQEYPSLILEKVQGSQRIRVLRLSDEEKERREQRLQREAWERLIVEQVGLYRIFYALSRVAQGFELDRSSPLLAASLDDIDWDREPSLYRGARHRKIPIVVHNGFMDLCFLLTHFVVAELPDVLSDCKQMIRNFFPLIFDTKILALEFSPAICNSNTRLGALFERVSSTLDFKVRTVPTISTNGSHAADAQENGCEEHFADYDAYMTGVCFLGICQSILRMTGNGVVAEAHVGTLEHLLLPITDNRLRKSFRRNLLYQMSMFTLDLEDKERDPLCRGMEKESTFRVTKIDPSTTTRDIVNAVSGIYDRDGRPVSFEIIWVDDTTFMVAATSRQQVGSPALQDDALLLHHGKLICGALKHRFSDSIVISLGTHLENLELERQKEMNKISAANRLPLAKRLLSYFGIGYSQDHVKQPPTKKMKLV